jgi:hypothetical protein
MTFRNNKFPPIPKVRPDYGTECWVLKCVGQFVASSTQVTVSPLCDPVFTVIHQKRHVFSARAWSCLTETLLIYVGSKRRAEDLHSTPSHFWALTKYAVGGFRLLFTFRKSHNMQLPSQSTLANKQIQNSHIKRLKKYVRETFGKPPP